MGECPSLPNYYLHPFMLGRMFTLSIMLFIAIVILVVFLGLLLNLLIKIRPPCSMSIFINFYIVKKSFI